MDRRRYQVFLSSTYRDLVEERKEIIQAILELDYFPAGMEMFPASSDDAWSLIKSVIDDSDIYVVVVGNRYGSISDDGISFTQKEYEYAICKNIPVLPFLHNDPESVPARDSDLDPASQVKLKNFRTTLENTHHAKYFTNPQDLGSKVSRSLVASTRSITTSGWIRGDAVASADAVNEINRLRAQLEKLTVEFDRKSTEPPPDSLALARGDEYIPLSYTWQTYDKEDTAKINSGSNEIYFHKDTWESEQLPISWDDAFSVCGPLMFNQSTEPPLKRAIETRIRSYMEKHNKEYINQYGSNIHISDDDFQAIKVQFIALGYIKKSDKQRSVKDQSTYWTLTSYGEHYLMSLRAIKAGETTDADEGDTD